MDADNERVRKDDPLRSIFHAAGHLTAPTELEDRVLERLSGPEAVIRPEPPLIGWNGWLSIAALLVALVVAGMWSPAPGREPSMLTDLTSSLRVTELTDILNSRWTVAAIAVMVALTVMDRLLLRRVRVFFAL
ncbi:MAG: hypothetical protein JNL43_16840 [Flavobacteriales bacterium]|nr:hypothetical protein [Flavobacteriales bacterium]